MPAAASVRPNDIVRAIGTTNDQALAYVLAPDPQLSRLGRKTREALLPDLPPVVAGAFLGPEALARHFIASAAAGRYRDLFALWELFRARPEECKPVLAERSAALAKGRAALQTATRLGIVGHAERVAQDIVAAQGLIWQWLRETLGEHLEAIGRRPLIAAALLGREPDLGIPLPDDPDVGWVTEAAAARTQGPLPVALEERFAPRLHLLPPSVITLTLAHEHYRDQVPALLEGVNLDDPESARILAWARDHGLADRLHARAAEAVEQATATDRAEGLRRWYEWQERGVELPLPSALQAHTLQGLDLARPETAVLAARLESEGADFGLQAELDAMAAQNRQNAEKAYEAMVCAGIDVTLPKALEDSPFVREGTRCRACGAWTWVRPGHEQRCPRPMPAGAPEEPAAVSAEPDLAAEWTAAQLDELQQDQALPDQALPDQAPAGEAPPAEAPPAADQPEAAPPAATDWSVSAHETAAAAVASTDPLALIASGAVAAALEPTISNGAEPAAVAQPDSLTLLAVSKGGAAGATGQPALQPAPDQLAPGPAALDEMAPAQAAPDQLPPEQAATDAPAQAAPDQLPPEQAATDAPAQPAPDQLPPEQAATDAPAQAAPDQLPPEQAATDAPAQPAAEHEAAHAAADDEAAEAAADDEAADGPADAAADEAASDAQSADRSETEDATLPTDRA